MNGTGPGQWAALRERPATVPGLPRNLTVIVGDGFVGLSWDEPASNGGARIIDYQYRYAAGASVPVDTAWTDVGGSQLQLFDLANGTDYAFEIRAMNRIGGGDAATVTATPGTRPGAPQNLAATSGDGQVTLAWQAPASDGGNAIVRYEYAQSLNGTPDWISVGTDLTVTVGNLTNGTRYSFQVRAVNGEGEGMVAIASTTPVAAATVPGMPQNLLAVTGDSVVLLDWDPPASDGGAPITAYEYRYAEGASVPDDTAWTGAGLALTVRLGDLMNGTDYAFEVRARNRVGAGAAATATTAPVTIPHPPQNFTATPGDGAVTLTWEASPDDGGAAIVRYEYRFAESIPALDDAAWTSAGLALSATRGNLTNGTEYFFMIRSVNRIGPGAEIIAQATPMAGATAPGAPRNLTATPGDGAVTLAWQAPASDGGAAVTGYRYRYAEGASVPAGTAWSAAGRVLSLTVSGLADGTGLAFEVRAINRVGHGPAARTSVTVLPLPTLSAHDARAQEGVDTAIDFAVALSRASTRAVTVDYATAEGSAMAGEDYRRTAGTLTFLPGDIEKTVSVPLLDDAKDENEETFTLVLSNAAGAHLVRARATGTISNDGDAMPRAWLLRFGRTVAGQVVDAMNARFDGPPPQHMTVAGVPVATGGAPIVREDRPPGPRPPALLSPDEVSVAAGPMLRDVMLGSSFHLSAQESGDGATVTAWGRASAGSFEAQVGDTRMDGSVATGILGIDAAWDDVIAGAAVSYSEGEGRFGIRGGTASNRAHGAVESRLTGVYPYVQLRPNDRVSVWGLAGMGRGNLTLNEEGGAPIRTGTSLALGAFGIEGSLAPAAETGGVALTLGSDGFWVRTDSGAVDGDRTGSLKATAGEAMRGRLTLQGEKAFELGEGETLTPRIEVGIRHDDGDAETGTGFELGAGVRYHAPGITIEGEVHALVDHEAAGYEEWGASGSIHIDPGPSGRGVLLRLTPAWGADSRGVDRLRTPSGLVGFAPADSVTAGGHVDAELGYGLRAPGGRGVVTPYAGLSLSDDGNRRMRLGARWAVAPALTLGLEASRDEASGARHENTLMVRAATRW